MMAHSSHLHVWGTPVRFEPLADATRGMVEPGALSAASSVQRVQERLWHQAWRQARSSTLRISVLGGSVACGGGAAFPSSSSDLGGSWVRRMADALRDELAAVGLESVRATVNLACKGGVTPDYFAMCSGTSLGAADVVLVEFEPNMDMDAHHGQPISVYNLRLLLQEVRRALPLAPIVFIGWPSFYQWLTAPAIEALEEIEARLKQVALAADGVDGLFASQLMLQQTSGGRINNATLVLQKIRETFYAEQTHPRQAGHALLGTAAARFVATRMRHAAVGGSSSLAAVAEPGRAGTKARRSWCFQRADELPVAAPGGWQLVNEGGAQVHGTRKLGFLSTHVGQSLVLGPLVPELRCATLAVSLGVLQSWRRDQGALRVDCSGCDCVEGNEKWRRKEDLQATRFPLVETHSHLLPRSTVTLPNATVTVQTRFFVVKDERECFVNITHVTWPARDEARSVRHSRVRVDNLALQEPQCGSVCRLALRGNHAQRRAGLHAKECAQRHEASKACWNLGPQDAAGARACRLEEDVYVYSGQKRSRASRGFVLK